MKATKKGVLLTFDVEGFPGREDLISTEIISALHNVLKLLKKYDLKGLFFITGTVAEKIGCYPQVLELLRVHEIGYHSSSHSVKPRIFEYADIKSYERAVEISRQRETSSIDPFTGSIKGRGGILALRQIFPEKRITSFRAPFLCWTPPHLEALRELRVRFDFSTCICSVPVSHKGITFMPFPTVIDSISWNFPVILKRMLSEDFLVFLMHPSHTTFKLGEPSYRQSNSVSIQTKKRVDLIIKSKFSQLELFFLVLRELQRNRLIEIKGSLEESKKSLELKTSQIKKVYEKSVQAPEKLFGYEPKFLWSHFQEFLMT